MWFVHRPKGASSKCSNDAYGLFRCVFERLSLFWYAFDGPKYAFNTQKACLKEGKKKKKKTPFNKKN
jgi:hypothetical protein